MFYIELVFARFGCEGQADVDRFFPRSYDMSSASEVQEMDSLDGGRNMEEDDYQQKDNGVMMCKMLMDLFLMRY